MATKTVKYFEKRHLQLINHEAAKQNYNRQLNNDFIDDLSDDYRYPIIMTLEHEHAQGKPVERHMRCFFSALNVVDGLIAIDVPMILYKMLPTATVDIADSKK